MHSIPQVNAFIESAQERFMPQILMDTGQAA
jgi:hypothetical protein